MQQYFLSLGSNIEPQKNMVKIIEALLELSEILVLSKIIRTKPVGIYSPNYFLNAAACIETNKTEQELKKQLVQIEETLGRDRSDPDRKIKDRTADIDILFAIKKGSKNTPIIKSQTETYVILPLLDILDFMNISQFQSQINSEMKATPVGLWIGEQSIGKKAVRLYQNKC